MAQFRTYICEDCGFSIDTDPHGHYALMRGQYYTFRCTKCKKIVSISAEKLNNQGYFPTCPNCGADKDHLYTWNAHDGKCPQCGSDLKEVEGICINAD